MDATLETNGATEETEETEETSTPVNADGVKKHAKPLIYTEVDGETVLAERVWTSHIFPKQQVRDFAQYCRDTEQKPTEITSKILADGMVAVFAEVARTKAERDEARSAKTLPTDAEVLAKQEAALIARMDRLRAKMDAVKAKAEAIKAGIEAGIPASLPVDSSGDAAVTEMEALLDEAEAQSVTATKRGRKG